MAMLSKSATLGQSRREYSNKYRVICVGNEVKIVPTDSLIIGNSDDTSNRIVLNNTQHGSETLFVDIGKTLEYAQHSQNYILERPFKRHIHIYKSKWHNDMFVSKDEGTVFTTIRLSLFHRNRIT